MLTLFSSNRESLLNIPNIRLTFMLVWSAITHKSRLTCL